jgi:hypothetical protein
MSDVLCPESLKIVSRSDFLPQLPSRRDIRTENRDWVGLSFFFYFKSKIVLLYPFNHGVHQLILETKKDMYARQ